MSAQDPTPPDVAVGQLTGDAVPPRRRIGTTRKMRKHDPEGDVGRRGVLVRHHVEYAEFSCT